MSSTTPIETGVSPMKKKGPSGKSKNAMIKKPPSDAGDSDESDCESPIKYSHQSSLYRSSHNSSQQCYQSEGNSDPRMYPSQQQRLSGGVRSGSSRQYSNVTTGRPKMSDNTPPHLLPSPIEMMPYDPNWNSMRSSSAPMVFPRNARPNPSFMDNNNYRDFQLNERFVNYNDFNNNVDGSVAPRNNYYR